MSTPPGAPVPDGPPAGTFHLAVALEGAGAHPAAWREPGSPARELVTPGYWAGLVAEAERGLLDFVTFEDALGPPPSSPTGPDGRTDRVRGRLDAVLTAARVAPLTRHIGLLPTVVATHTEPFHVSKAIATLDYVSGGRAGLLVTVSGRPDEARHFGRRTFPRGPADSPDGLGSALRAELLDEAADHVEVVRRLWDSWEDDAEIRDVASGRFVDRGKLHHIGFEGRHFSVKGPSITPRPPQGQPLVGASARVGAPPRLLAEAVDLVFLAPRDTEEVRTLTDGIRAARSAAGQPEGTGRVFADLVVFLDESATAATARLRRLDALAQEPYAPGTHVFAGTPARLAALLTEWHRRGPDGFRLRPGVLSHDLPAITRGLVPELRRRGALRTARPGGTFRDLLGLARPASRYAARYATTRPGRTTAP
ncbi:LLM class flavin-dependent oxidoreductase [Streptomyces sp. NBC_00536]|uniref:LLM class flavin-dependent oxidoreductase n=1 Tax=Streptomyces sp. NBC_00536 TaxID=2975769 RepID=UPI002E80E4C9|nr:LLM class flavin-dependent oxidoreductase [Streptomyces sp. NBC_00536]WUC82581.1 LLM class flavin-dependent oxidoreductase [Streptomyces sp. NBC_00536]